MIFHEDTDMKKRTSLCLLALLLVCTALFSACGKSAYTLTYADGAFENAKKELAFQEAPVCYRAASALKGETVANISGFRPNDIPLYAIEGMDADEFLTDDSFTLYYEKGVKLPTLTELNTSHISLSELGNDVAMEIDRLEDTAAIGELVTMITDGTSYPSQKLAAYSPKRFEILFFSQDYEGIIYVLEYWKYTDTTTFLDNGQEINVGKGVVYNRAADRFYIMGDVLENHFINT